MARSEGGGLAVSGLRAGYGPREVLAGLSLSVRQGEFLGLLGHNGAGKSTLLKAISGALPLRSGCVALDGTDLSAQKVRRRLEAGLVYVPQGNPVFSQMSVRENLLLRLPDAVPKRDRRDEVARVLASFPQLRGRESQRAGSLSGGEKQILSLAGALLTRPRFLLLDEPCLGLAPALVVGAMERFRELANRAAVGIILVEQKVRDVLAVADRILVMRQGTIILDEPAASLAGDEKRVRELCL